MLFSWCSPISRISKAVSVKSHPIASSSTDQNLVVDLSPEEITDALQLTKLKDRLWYVVPSIATEGTGIFEGLVSNPSYYFFFFVI